MPEKARNYTPIIIGAAVAVVVIAGLAYRPLEKRSLLKAVASGTKPGYDAAWMMPTLGTGAISSLCGVIDRGSDKGRLAAAGGLARIARTGGGNDVLNAVRARLEGSPSPEARAAYAAALSQAGTPGCAKAAAALVTDAEPSVRKCVVHGLAHGKRTREAAAALGAALGDEDADIRDFAEATLNDWAKRDSGLMLDAADAAMSLVNQVAHKGAARILSVVARSAGDERLKVLLRDASPDVRRLGASAVAVSGSADPEIQKALADIVGSPAEPVAVREAALEAARAIRAVPVGGAALEILKGRGDAGLRAKAAGVVAVTRPEGATDVLMSILADARAPQKLRIGVLDAFFAAGRIEGQAQIKVARELTSIAEGGDEAAAGLALLALRSVSGLRAVKYGAKQWRNWLERREYERELVRKAPLVMEKMKAEYDVHGDPDRVIQHEVVNKIGSLLQEARDGADQQDQAPLQEWITKLVKFKDGYR